MTVLKPPRAPNGLKSRGNALWRTIMQNYALDEGEKQLLHELCRVVDRLDQLENQLAEDGLMVTGTRGQLPKAHPLLLEQREAQKTMSRLVAELALPMPGEQAGRRRSPNQKAAADTRWSRDRRLRSASG